MSALARIATTEESLDEGVRQVAAMGLPMGDRRPGFDAKADWPLLERALRKAGIPVPPGVAERAARRR